MDIGLLNGLFTLGLLLAFIGLVAWAWSRRRKTDFDAAAQLPLEPVTRSPPAGNDRARRADDHRNDNEGSP
jgi:cytochrome c oxidase cbb3-type subunit 4